MQLRVFRSEAEEEKFKNYTCLELTQKMPIARYHWGIIGPPHSELSTVAEVENRRICLVGTVLDDEGTVKAAQSFGIPVITSETGSEYILDHDWVTYFVVNQFDGPMFEAIHKSKHRILGPPALKQLFLAKDVLPSSNRPIYNYAMKGVITCFTGIRKKEELTHLVSLIHAMGGKIRKDMNSRITHLICNNSGGEKYQYAMTFRLTVVRSDWVLAAWERRNEMDFSANEEDFSRMHRTKAFEGQRICFFGFSPDEHQHMVDVLVANGGAPANIDDPECTHVIVDEHAVHSKLDVINSKTHILKADWFWYTIQNGFADETDYRFDDYLDSIANTPCSDRRDSLPVTFNKRKRKRLSRTIKEELTPLGLGKRRSSVSDAGLLSVSGSFLECTASPDKNDVSKPIPEAEVTPDVPVSTKKQSMRYNHFLDFYQTESNYVGILDTIVKLFKEPLEKMADSNPSDALLNKSEIRAIFSNFLPIHDVHWKMLNSIKELQVNWAEDCLIGKIILDHRDDLIKAYPPYVNFFEQMKDALILCDNQKPRFHAFLKINQAKPECGRQSLQDLMIRPVQRLPSISLLINDILKHTPKSNPDAKKLEEALRAIKEVMTYINEDKRKTDGQIAMFDIFNDIDNCPPDLVSAQRSLVSKCEVTELSDQLSGRGDSLMLCLFTDNIEVCKKRSRGFNQAKSPSTTMNGLNVTTKVKSYKHIKLIPLSSIRFVVDIRDSPRAFALSCRLSKENKDKEYYFSINEEEVDKTMYLRSLCKQLAENSCRADADQFLASVDSTELSIDISDLNIGTLSKAFKFATRTRLKVGRAFSFNKTPSKLKRAVSTMMTNSLTPASQLAQMKLASCNNINVEEEGTEAWQYI
ncbi:protein ECT2 isoform X9 [Lutzomyia longipalpis]|uniref:protein ECT2 isoform X9 n=1 Tax=Lutzomyia longipalpis TaxID=7200 RepID=UPI0024834482|nr:protein ECT2 isoform X9 [Lutzomyia longipalpis]